MYLLGESPKIFTAATETIADLATQALDAGAPQAFNRLDAVSEQAPPEHATSEQAANLGDVIYPCPAPLPTSTRQPKTPHYHPPPLASGMSMLTLFFRARSRQQEAMAWGQVLTHPCAGLRVPPCGQGRLSASPRTRLFEENGQRRCRLVYHQYHLGLGSGHTSTYHHLACPSPSEAIKPMQRRVSLLKWL
jgi:hypothetical protein